MSKQQPTTKSEAQEIIARLFQVGDALHGISTVMKHTARDEFALFGENLDLLSYLLFRELEALEKSFGKDSEPPAAGA